MSSPHPARPLPAFSSLLAFVHAVPASSTCVDPTSPSRSSPRLASPGPPSQADFSFSPSTAIAKAARLRSAMNHLVLISGVPSGLPTPRPGRPGCPWGVCAAKRAARGSRAPPCGRTAGRPEAEGPGLWKQSPGASAPLCEVTEGGRYRTLRDRALGVVGDQRLLPAWSTE